MRSAALSLGLPICKMGMTIVALSQGCSVKCLVLGLADTIPLVNAKLKMMMVMVMCILQAVSLEASLEGGWRVWELSEEGG